VIGRRGNSTSHRRVTRAVWPAYGSSSCGVALTIELKQVAQRETLTENQVAVLRWIAEGCPSNVMQGDSPRISAAALKRRGLVTTTGHGPSWAARISQAGREYLEKVDGADPPIPRQANVSVTQQLVDDVLAAGGSLRVPRKHRYDRAGVDYASRARLAQRYGKVPAGKRLAVSVLSSAELEIKLVEAPGQPDGGLVPVLQGLSCDRHGQSSGLKMSSRCRTSAVRPGSSGAGSVRIRRRPRRSDARDR
jgi:hypothetical protein